MVVAYNGNSFILEDCNHIEMATSFWFVKLLTLFSIFEQIARRFSSRLARAIISPIYGPILTYTHTQLDRKISREGYGSDVTDISHVRQRVFATRDSYGRQRRPVHAPTCTSYIIQFQQDRKMKHV